MGVLDEQPSSLSTLHVYCQWNPFTLTPMTCYKLHSSDVTSVCIEYILYQLIVSVNIG